MIGISVGLAIISVLLVGNVLILADLVRAVRGLAVSPPTQASAPITLARPDVVRAQQPRNYRLGPRARPMAADE